MKDRLIFLFFIFSISGNVLAMNGQEVKKSAENGVSGQQEEKMAIEDAAILNRTQLYKTLISLKKDSKPPLGFKKDADKLLVRPILVHMPRNICKRTFKEHSNFLDENFENSYIDDPHETNTYFAYVTFDAHRNLKMQFFWKSDDYTNAAVMSWTPITDKLTFSVISQEPKKRNLRRLYDSLDLKVKQEKLVATEFSKQPVFLSDNAYQVNLTHQPGYLYVGANPDELIRIEAQQEKTAKAQNKGAQTKTETPKLNAQKKPGFGQRLLARFRSTKKNKKA